MDVGRVIGGPHAALATYLLLILLGMLTCFLGYRLFKIVLGIWGFVAGFALAANLAASWGLDPVVRLGVAVLGGLGGAVLVTLAYLVGVFLFGAGFGLIIASTVQELLHLAAPSWPLVLVLGGIGGVAALMLQKPLIKLFTAFSGAWILVAAVGALVLRCPIETFPAGCARSSFATLVVLVAWLVVGAIGFAVQARARYQMETEHRRRR